MPIIDITLQRRPRWFGAHAAAKYATSFQPSLEVLETRECLSVAAPTGLQLAIVSSTQVSLTWNDVAGAQGYDILGWNGTKITNIAQASQGTTTWTVGGLQPNQQQWLTVEAFDASSTAYSPWASIDTPPDAITAATNLHVASATPTTVTLQWTLGTGATGYLIYGWNGSSAVQAGSVSATTNTFVVKNLAAGSTNYFYVEAYNATNSIPTDWLAANTLASAVTAPTNFKAQTVNITTIALTWKAATGQTGYTVYRWDGKAASPPVLVTTLAANTTSYQATDLMPGTMYWFYVQAFNNSNSANTAWAQATTAGAVPLQPPGNVVGKAVSATSVLLTWTEPARALDYVVFVWTGSVWKQAGMVAAGTHQLVVTGLATAQSQWFMVEAVTDNPADASYSSAVFVNL